jgi:hypothetical protein
VRQYFVLLLLFLSNLGALAQPGLPLWTNRFPNAGCASGVAVASTGVIVVAGSSTNASGNDFTTVAYSSNGQALWTNFYDGPLHGNDLAKTVVISQQGRIYVAGSSQNSAGKYDFALLAYDFAGTALWTNRFHGPFTTNDTLSSACVDSAGRVYIVGTSYTSDFDSDWITLSYSPNGAPLWTNRFNDSTGEGTNLVIVANDTGQLFITGRPSKAIGMWTVAYSTNGTPLWTNRANGLNYTDRSSAIATRKNGNVIVAGTPYTGPTPYGRIAIEYRTNGAALWTNRFIEAQTVIKNVATDDVSSTPAVVIGGECSNTNNGIDLLVLKYTGLGVPLWTNRFTEADTLTNRMAGIAIDQGGTIAVAGFCTNSQHHSEVRALTYTSTGLPLWTNRYRASATSDDIASAITLDPVGNVLISGTATIKYLSNWKPLLAGQLFSSGLVLTWTNSPCHLQTAPSLSGPYTTMNGVGSPYTNDLTGPSRYFRLLAE